MIRVRMRYRPWPDAGARLLELSGEQSTFRTRRPAGFRTYPGAPRASRPRRGAGAEPCTPCGTDCARNPDLCLAGGAGRGAELPFEPRVQPDIASECRCELHRDARGVQRMRAVAHGIFIG